MLILNHLFILLISWFLIMCKIYANDDLSLRNKFTLNNQTTEIFNSYQNSSNKILKRTKRGIFQLSGIIKCMTGCKPLSYRRYGCFCGIGDMGSSSPVDKIDKCCQEHDHCYSQLQCSHIMVYILPYQWKCTDNNDATCTALAETKTMADKCSYQLCECDRLLGNCLKNEKCPEKKLQCTVAQHAQHTQQEEHKDEY